MRDEVIAGIEVIPGHQISGIFIDVPVYQAERANSGSDKQRGFDEFEECDDAQQPVRAGNGHGNRVNGCKTNIHHAVAKRNQNLSCR